MDEDNDDQWLYGEDSIAEKTTNTDKTEESSVNTINECDEISVSVSIEIFEKATEIFIKFCILFHFRRYLYLKLFFLAINSTCLFTIVI